MSVDLAPVVEELLSLGGPGTHPAGAVVGVRCGDQTAVASGGYAVLAGSGRDARPMTPDTRLDLASVTKVASTTALAMRLVARGDLDLDRPVAAYLPHLTRDHGAVRVRHLLEHTSGLPPWLPLYCRTSDRDEALRLAAAAPLRSEPGARWTYSDLGMIALGAVLESVTGLRQDDAFAALVAAPLSLRRTGYGPVPAPESAASGDGDVIEWEMVASGSPYRVDARVEDWAGWRHEPQVGVVNDGNAAHALGGVAGHAGLFSTVPDLLRLGRALVDSSLAPAEVVDTFTRPLDVDPGRALGFRLATLSLAGEDVPLAVHGGFTGTHLAVALDRDLVIVAAATRLHGTTGVPARPLAPRESLVSTDEIASAAMGGVARALAPTLDASPAQTGAP